MLLIITLNNIFLILSMNFINYYNKNFINFDFISKNGKIIIFLNEIFNVDINFVLNEMFFLILIIPFWLSNYTIYRFKTY